MTDEPQAGPSMADLDAALDGDMSHAEEPEPHVFWPTKAIESAQAERDRLAWIVERIRIALADVDPVNLTIAAAQAHLGEGDPDRAEALDRAAFSLRSVFRVLAEDVR